MGRAPEFEGFGFWAYDLLCPRLRAVYLWGLGGLTGHPRLPVPRSGTRVTRRNLGRSVKLAKPINLLSCSGPAHLLESPQTRNVENQSKPPPPPRITTSDSTAGFPNPNPEIKKNAKEPSRNFHHGAAHDLSQARVRRWGTITLEP